MGKHTTSCKNLSCTGCKPDPNDKAIRELQTTVINWKETSNLEYKRGQKYKLQRNELEEENKKLKGEVEALRDAIKTLNVEAHAADAQIQTLEKRKGLYKQWLKEENGDDK